MSVLDILCCDEACGGKRISLHVADDEFTPWLVAEIHVESGSGWCGDIGLTRASAKRLGEWLLEIAGGP